MSQNSKIEIYFWYFCYGHNKTFVSSFERVVLCIKICLIVAAPNDAAPLSYKKELEFAASKKKKGNKLLFNVPKPMLQHKNIQNHSYHFFANKM